MNEAKPAWDDLVAYALEHDGGDALPATMLVLARKARDRFIASRQLKLQVSELELRAVLRALSDCIPGARPHCPDCGSRR